jgi:hypothetical protein
MTKKTSILIACSTIYLVGIVGCGILGGRAVNDPRCADLFRRETPRSDSIPGDLHTPPEAEATLSAYVALQPTATPWPNVDCQQASVQLLMETVEGVPSDLKAFFDVSPSGRHIAIQQYTEDRLIVLDQVTGERRDFIAPGVAFFWTDDSHLFISDEQWYSINTETGLTTSFESRWEYNQPDLSRFTRDVYTGWQAASALQVKDEAICDAVREGVLHPIPASDGSLLLRRDELLEHGAEIVRDAYSELISSQEVTRLRESADNAVVVERYWIDAPLEYGYENKTWQKLLILTGLPKKPRNLIVHVASKIHWTGYPLIPNEERIAGGAIRGRDLHPDYLVSTELCAAGTDKVFVLFAKDDDGEGLTALGSISYKDYQMYNQEGNRSEMVWSPDGGFIYISEWLDGQYSIYRLQLPPP